MILERLFVLAIVIVQLANIGVTAVVIPVHARVLRAAGRGNRGLLSWHVVAIATSYLGVTTMAAVGLLERKLGVALVPEPVRLVGYLLFAVIGLAALIIILQAQLRVTPLRPRTVVAVQNDVVLDDGPPTP